MTDEETTASGPVWRQRIVGYDDAVAPADLLAHPDNFRRHGDAQRSALRGSLTRVGWVDVVSSGP